MCNHKAVSKRVNDSLEAKQRESAKWEDRRRGEEERVSEVTATEIPRSAFWVLLQTWDERQRGQMSKVISVRPDKLQLAISYYSEA